MEQRGGSSGAEPGGAKGYGEKDPVTGLHRWIDLGEQARGDRLSWAQLLEHWQLIEADLHERYGLDLTEPVLRGRSWRWLRIRVEGLLAVPPQVTDSGVVVQATRLGGQLRPPEPPKQR